MISKWIITGDTHGQNQSRLHQIYDANKNFKGEIGVIILGDAGYNYYLNKTDRKGKKETYGLKVYCVRGNHEERPYNLGYETEFDMDIQGMVYVDPVNPSIRYFLDGFSYRIGDYNTLVIGGAYSVDKWYRLDGKPEDTTKWTGWFKDEQLSKEERAVISTHCIKNSYDLVLTHTCPLSFVPTDLFLPYIDQSTVDRSMEEWLEQIKDTFKWKVWCFGHYHADRIERPYVEQFYRSFKDLDEVMNFWKSFSEQVE